MVVHKPMGDVTVATPTSIQSMVMHSAPIGKLRHTYITVWVLATPVLKCQSTIVIKSKFASVLFFHE